MLKLLVLLLLAFSAPAMAGPLQDAKAAGLVGETPDGYVAPVSGPAPDVAALIEQVNAERRAHYEQVAGETGTSAEDVAALAAEKLYQRAQPGEFLLMDGAWVQK